jgi:hypothetical protein
MTKTKQIKAKSCKKHYNELSNDLIIVMSANGDQEAKEERLIREIMTVDGVEWKDANKTFLKIMQVILHDL